MEIPDEIEEELEDRGGLTELLEKLNNLDIEQKSKVHKALSNKVRLKILALLKEQDLCVCLLKEILDIKDSKLSYHLSVLKEEDLIEGERDANFMIYRLTERGDKFTPR